MTESLNLFGQSAARYSFDRVLACRINISNQQDIGAVKGARKIILQVARAGVTMWLKQSDYSSAGRSRRRKRSLYFCRMMTVIIYHQHRALLSFDLESALCTAETSQHRCDRFKLDAQIQPHRDRRQRLVDIVQTRHCKLDRPQLLSKRADRKLRSEIGVQVYPRSRNIGLSRRPKADYPPSQLRDDRLYVRIVQTRNNRSIKRNAIGKLDKTLLDLLDTSSEMIEMIGIDVRHYRDRRR